MFGKSGYLIKGPSDQQSVIIYTVWIVDPSQMASQIPELSIAVQALASMGNDCLLVM